ncbi:hypothetical protein MMC15_003212 [Xylographa vitiligo]|nr:hypothetical protein [Xylographa vitiligo]
MLSVNAATTNVTNTNFTHEIRLVDGLFGLQELKSVLSFRANNGGIWTLSIQTSDLAVLMFTILVLTFAIDHYIFRSRYLVHIRGAKRVKNPVVALNEKAALYEREALKVESGQQCGNDEHSDPESQPKHDSDQPVSSIFLRWVYKALLISLILLLSPVDGEQKEVASGTDKVKPESSGMKAEAEWQADIPPSTSLWRRVAHHPWFKAVVRSAMLLVAILSMLVVFTFHLLFWPAILVLVILHQCASYEYFDDNAIVPWQSIALKSILQLVVWTTVAVTLLMKPNRFQAVLWKCFKWTHAVNWWLWWAVLESHSVCFVAARRYGLHYDSKITMQVFFFVQPTLIAYLCSGIVCDVVVAIRLCKVFRTIDLGDREILGR